MVRKMEYLVFDVDKRMMKKAASVEIDSVVLSVDLVADGPDLFINIEHAEMGGERMISRILFDTKSSANDYLNKSIGFEGKDWFTDLPSNRNIYTSPQVVKRVDRSANSKKASYVATNKLSILPSEHELAEYCSYNVLSIEAYRDKKNYNVVLKVMPKLIGIELFEPSQLETKHLSLDYDGYSKFTKELKELGIYAQKLGQENSVSNLYCSHEYGFVVEELLRKQGLSVHKERTLLVDTEILENHSDLQPNTVSPEQVIVSVPTPTPFDGYVYKFRSGVKSDEVEATIRALEPNLEFCIDEHFLYSNSPICNMTLDSCIAIEPLDGDISEAYYKEYESLSNGTNVFSGNFAFATVKLNGYNGEINRESSLVNIRTGSTLVREIDGIELVVDPAALERFNATWVSRTIENSELPTTAYKINRLDASREFTEILSVTDKLGGIASRDFEFYADILSYGRDSAFMELKGDLATKLRFLELSQINIPIPYINKSVDDLCKVTEFKKVTKMLLGDLGYPKIANLTSELIDERIASLLKDTERWNRVVDKVVEQYCARLIKKLKNEGLDNASLIKRVEEESENCFVRMMSFSHDLLRQSVDYQIEPKQVNYALLEKKVNSQLKTINHHFDNWLNHKLSQIAMTPALRVGDRIVDRNEIGHISGFLNVSDSDLTSPRAILDVCKALNEVSLGAAGHSNFESICVSESDDAIRIQGHVVSDFVDLSEQLAITSCLDVVSSQEKLTKSMFSLLSGKETNIESIIETEFGVKPPRIIVDTALKLATELRLLPVSSLQTIIEPDELDYSDIKGVLLPFPANEIQIAEQNATKMELMAKGIENFVYYSTNDPISKSNALSKISDSGFATHLNVGNGDNVIRKHGDIYEVAIELQQSLPYMNVEILPSFDDPRFPLDIRQAQSSVSGLALHNKLYINSSINNITKSKLKSVLLHEAMHVGFNRTMDLATYNQTMEMVWRGMSKEDREAINAIYTHYNPTTSDRYILAEEWLARRAENIDTISSTSKGLFSSLKRHIKAHVFGDRDEIFNIKVEKIITTALQSLKSRHAVFDSVIDQNGNYISTLGAVNMGEGVDTSSSVRLGIQADKPFIIDGADGKYCVCFTDVDAVQLEGRVVTFPLDRMESNWHAELQRILWEQNEKMKQPTSETISPYEASMKFNPLNILPEGKELNTSLPSWLEPSQDIKFKEKSKQVDVGSAIEYRNDFDSPVR